MTKVLFLAGYFQPLSGYGVAQEVEDVFNYLPGSFIFHPATQKQAFSGPKSAPAEETGLSGLEVGMVPD